MQRTFFAIMILASTAMAADTLPPPSGETIVAPEGRLELLFTRSAPIQGGLTEGPAVAPDGSIYFSDIPFGADKGMILRFDPKTRKTTVFADDSGKSNGLIFNREGFLVACEGANYGGRRVSRWNVASRERTTIVDNYQGKKFNAPNDLCLDRTGRMYLSDPRYVGDEPRELEHRAVYRIDPGSSRAVEFTREVVKPNGLALSPDQKTLYVADHDNGTDKIDPTKPAPPQGVMRIYGFPLDSQGNLAGPRRTVLDFGDDKGCDGMTVDSQGHIYLTHRSVRRPGVKVIDPQGREVAFIPTGLENQPAAELVGLPSNVEFGLGDEAHVLYITVDTSLYRIPLKVQGFHHQYR